MTTETSYSVSATDTSFGTQSYEASCGSGQHVLTGGIALTGGYPYGEDNNALVFGDVLTSAPSSSTGWIGYVFQDNTGNTVGTAIVTVTVNCN